MDRYSFQDGALLQLVVAVVAKPCALWEPASELQVPRHCRDKTRTAAWIATPGTCMRVHAVASDGNCMPKNLSILQNPYSRSTGQLRWAQSLFREGHIHVLPAYASNVYRGDPRLNSFHEPLYNSARHGFLEHQCILRDARVAPRRAV